MPLAWTPLSLKGIQLIDVLNLGSGASHDASVGGEADPTGAVPFVCMLRPLIWCPPQTTLSSLWDPIYHVPALMLDPKTSLCICRTNHLSFVGWSLARVLSSVCTWNIAPETIYFLGVPICLPKCVSCDLAFLLSKPSIPSHNQGHNNCKDKPKGW